MNQGAPFRLAAACCRPLDDPDRPRAVARAAETTDWPAFLAEVDRHRIAGLAVRALADAGVAPPGEIGRLLQSRAAEAARRSLTLAAESVRLQRALDEAGIANLVLKGAALDTLAWGRIGLKQAWDIDLLVELDQVRPAASRLAELGYAPQGAPPELDDAGLWDAWLRREKDITLVRQDPAALVVELHWRASEAVGLLANVSARSMSRLAPLSPGLAVRTLPFEETFAHLCVHGSAHAWARLKWLADLGALLSPLSLEARDALRRRALALGAGRCVDLALALCEQLLGVAAPPESRTARRKDLSTRLLIALSLAAVRSRRDPEARLLLRDLVRLSQILCVRDLRSASKEAARIWASPRDRREADLAPWLGHLLRLPRWLGRRLAHFAPQAARRTR